MSLKELIFFEKQMPQNSSTPFWIAFIKLYQGNQKLQLDIGLCPAENPVMSDESYFTTDAVVRREVKKKKKVTDVLKLRSI